MALACDAFRLEVGPETAIDFSKRQGNPLNDTIRYWLLDVAGCALARRNITTLSDTSQTQKST